jgi:hypothetical protein
MPHPRFQFSLGLIFAVTTCVAVVVAGVRLLPVEMRLVVGLSIVIGLAECLALAVLGLVVFVTMSMAFRCADQFERFFSRKAK